MDDLLNNWCQYWFWSSSQLWSAGCTCLALNKSRCSLSTSSLSWERNHSLRRLCLMIFQLTWHLNDFRICCPSVGQPKLWRVFGRPFLPFASENTNPNGPKVTFHRQRIIPRQPLTFEVEIIDASQGLDSSSWHCRTMGVSKSYGASFWCPSDIILICTKKWLLCMTSLPYELVCSQNQLLSQIDCSLEKVSSVKLDITNSRNIL